jgi:hypothetical protein
MPFLRLAVLFLAAALWSTASGLLSLAGPNTDGTSSLGPPASAGLNFETGRPLAPPASGLLYGTSSLAPPASRLLYGTSSLGPPASGLLSLAGPNTDGTSSLGPPASAGLNFETGRPLAPPASRLLSLAGPNTDGTSSLGPPASAGLNFETRRPLAPPASSRGLEAFAVIQKVLQHPRCQNCHIPGDAPLQFDAGLPHGQNVLRGSEGKGSPGLACSTCHDTRNPPAAYGPHVPPGAPNWHLPPPSQKMVFINVSAADLCASLKDPSKNGGKDLAALLKHVSSDPLVLWSWDPGPGRAPVDTPHADFVAAFRTWMDAGAPCPPK